MTWKFNGACLDGSKFLIDGINVWEHKWNREEKEPNAVVRDPSYNQQFTFHVYRIETENKNIRFAAGEFSNCIWGFYTQE